MWECFCNTCAHDWREVVERQRFRSIEDLAAKTGARRDELVTLAEIGALNTLGGDRRSALWQVEQAVRPAGALFEEQEPSETDDAEPDAPPCPLLPMTLDERLVADYAGTSLTIGPHPMALTRPSLAMRGVLRAVDLSRAPRGRRVRVAGAVITRQRPGTAKGFVFLTLEDETGIANVIIRPDLYARQRTTVVEEPFLLVEGVLQNEEGVTSVRAERVERLGHLAIEPGSHDFY